MRRTISGLLVVLALVALAGSAYAHWCRVDARGDFQVLENNSTAVVRAWVTNSCWHNHNVLVTVAAQRADGSFVQGADTVFVPRKTSRPADVRIDSSIDRVAYVIATKLGAN